MGGRGLLKPDDRMSAVAAVCQKELLNPSEPPADQSEITTPSGHFPLAKSASVGHCPDFLDSDIDAFIAKMSVPPPPGTEPVTTKEKKDDGNSFSSSNGAIAMPHLEDSSNFCSSDLDDLFGDETFSALVIPPPPGDSASSLENIQIVPPISSLAEVNKKLKKKKLHSSSMDSLEPKPTSSSKLPDDSENPLTNMPHAGMFYSKMKHKTLPKSFSSQFPVSVFDSDSIKDVESPATVSEKLNSLLKSMQDSEDISNEAPSIGRTTSLRLKRSASSDLGSTKSFASDNSVTQSQELSITRSSSQERGGTSSGQTTPSSLHFSNGQQIGGNYSRHLRRAQSDETILGNSSSVSENPASKAASETLSALKMKLQSYRDRLLHRSDSLRKYEKQSATADTSKETETHQLHRSNSFSLGIRMMQEKSSLNKNSSNLQETSRSASDQQLVSNNAIENQGQTNSVWSGTLNDKKSTMMWNTLSVPRSSFRPLTSNQPQVGSKKAGPVKALTQVKNTQGKPTQKSQAPRPPLVSSRSVDLEHGRKGTQDDMSFTPEERTSSKVQPKPFSTVNKMWRPLSMSTSSIRDAHLDEVYRSFNNFDVLKEMSSAKSSSKRDMSKTKKEINDIAVNGDITLSSVSDESMALLSARVSEKHSNSVKRILTRKYGPNDFGQATSDVEQLLLELKQTMESLKITSIDRRPKQLTICKCELENQVRHFVNDAKILVSNAAQTKSKLANCLDSGIHTLAKIFLHSQATMLMMEAVYQAQHLGFEVIKVANAFKSTVSAAHAAVGHPVGDPHMKYLMRQATNLATLISNLLKSLKSSEQQ
ncbi:hypothetical protein ScPMuIL_010497 [Solemya velum]